MTVIIANNGYEMDLTLKIVNVNKITMRNQNLNFHGIEEKRNENFHNLKLHQNKAQTHVHTF